MNYLNVRLSSKLPILFLESFSPISYVENAVQIRDLKNSWKFSVVFYTTTL